MHGVTDAFKNLVSILFRMISWILTTYNQEEVLPKTLDFFLSEMEGMDIEFIVSDDGSSDNSVSVARKYSGIYSNVKSVADAHKGRGSALKNGFRISKGDIIVFSSSDIEVSRDYIESALKNMGDCDIILLSKNLPDSVSRNRSAVRVLTSFSYNLLLKLLYKTKFRDMQGVKILRAGRLGSIIGYCKSDGFFFDTELVLIAFKKGMKIIEMPWAYVDNRKSSVRFSTVIELFREMIKFYPRFRGMK